MEQHIRRLRLNHVANVRDLGGYEADGGMIRWNMLDRAGDLSGADEGDWERLKAAGVRTILDLRSASELRVKPDRPPQGISWYHLPLQTEEIDLEHPADLAGLAFLKSLRESYVIMAGENTGLLAAALARLTASLYGGEGQDRRSGGGGPLAVRRSPGGHCGRLRGVPHLQPGRFGRAGGQNGGL